MRTSLFPKDKIITANISIHNWNFQKTILIYHNIKKSKRIIDNDICCIIIINNNNK